MDNELFNGLLLVDLKKSGRSQKTNFRGTLSEALPVSVGVPQGKYPRASVFVINIIDLPIQLPQDVNYVCRKYNYSCSRAVYYFR